MKVDNATAGGALASGLLDALSVSGWLSWLLWLLGGDGSHEALSFKGHGVLEHLSNLAGHFFSISNIDIQVIDY